MVPNISQSIDEAVALQRHEGRPGSIAASTIASGAGWRILDVICTCGQHDLVRDEEHSHYSLALVLGGAFEYRGRAGSAQLAPGSILIGRAGSPFRCWHGHGTGDRCLAVQFEAEAFHELTAGIGAPNPMELPVAVPVQRHTAGLFAFAEMVVSGSPYVIENSFETAVGLADHVLTAARHAKSIISATVRAAEAKRILDLARWIEEDPAADHDLEQLACRVGLSKYHFIRAFKRVVGMPPYSFITRARLREACKGIAATDRHIIDVAMDAGFSDLSTFNHLFRRHFGATPRALRRESRGGSLRTLFDWERDESFGSRTIVARSAVAN
jgi:AraC family transcriptional regulator